ncbi:hypothetical protein [Flavobacterium gelatinilyticum]|uniref:hypothetical protein n=1 Tax=Flavobacterium gelatinilyticum TaxID=3003260 RepID=UPI0024802338|nr:hypothetical protein [Flavobacterium gelatinilyticum]
MKSTPDQIEDIKRDGYSIDFSNVFNFAFENYKKIALYSALIFVVFSFLAFIVVMGLATAFFGIKSITQDLFNVLNNENLSYLDQLITTAAIASISALFSPLGAGFLKMAECADHNKEFNFSTIFFYYKAPYFLQLFLVTFVLAVASTGISYVIDSLGVLYLGGAVSLMISYFTFFTIPLIIFGNLNAIDAIKSSVVLVSKNPLTLFALFIIGLIGSFSGLFVCIVGVLFTAIFNTSVTYAAYFSIFNAEEDQDSIDKIGNSDFK